MDLYYELENKIDRGETTWQEVYEFIQSLLAMRENNDYMYVDPIEKLEELR